MLKTYKFKLEPTKGQADKITWTLSMCRWLYNSMLEQRKFAYGKRGISLNYNKQANELPALKKEIPEFKQIQSQVLQHVAKRLDFAFQSFFRRLKKGENPGYPRFQGKNRYDSFTYPQSGFKLEGKFLKLSKIGNVRIKLHRQMEGNIKTCTIKRKNGKYYACFSCEMEALKQATTGKQVGIDLGVKHLAITSDGEFFEHPKYLRKSERKIKYLQRMVSRRKKGSNRRQKAVALLAKAWEQISNRRRDTAHKISRFLVNEYDLIVFEDLKITNMVKNHSLAKSIHDASWGMLIQFTTYKAEWAGKSVELVDPRNTSQACSKCGQIVKKTLKERTHRCSCGYVADRDVNAAKNILQKADGYVPEVCGQLELQLF
ncbi:RNA-guided endonuclease InsQ/TnpB family protein [Melghirimyces algeriensis]|uniref:Putative transposase n=1 Tax=Melghirimyces algeriensis TaxID=910412 RepID=A0A521F6R5_9BACL|nr:RNA-guided endonuclease TnpB family protein [Melghirimyces algeriensis]SMO91895.1 putative transposase [Melghirimyces algeriensis]